MKGALLHRWLNLLFSGLDGTYFKRKNRGLSVRMKI